MSDIPATSGAIARDVDELFFELIFADEDLLGAEFDAIVAAQWADPPESPICCGVTGY